MSIYVMSDVHGLKDRYDAMMEKLIKEEDTLYVLGDVVDRGPDGIAILQDLMRRPNVYMLLGNHEYMMMQYYQVVHKELEEPLDGWTIMDRWNRNGCHPTIAQFEALTLQEQDEILEYIADLPLAYAEVKVNDALYYLVHGCPQLAFDKGIITRDQAIANGSTVENFVWDRIQEDTPLFEDRCVITGHTPTVFLQKNRPFQIWSKDPDLNKTKLIDIDCGCAAASADSQLAVFCLDDHSVFYF